MFLERRGKGGGERREHRGDVVFAGNRLGEAALDDEGGCGAARIDHLVLARKRLVEPPYQVRAETGGERGPWRVGDLADGLQADPVHRRDRFRVEAQRRHRQRV